MTERRFDLEERSLAFARQVVAFCKSLPKSEHNVEYAKQLLRSAGSIGANYIEANEALGLKDFLMRIRIARKEAKESVYWLRLITTTNDASLQLAGSTLIIEGIELKKILSAIILKTESKT
jgi:four helix bundle protein